jgi:hypothetical protein
MMTTAPPAGSLSEPELLRAYLAGRDVSCAHCGYNLRDLVGRVCPECNTLIVLGVHAADPMWRYRRVAIWTLAIYAGIHLLSVLRVARTLMASWQFSPSMGNYVYYSMVYGIGQMAVLAAAGWILWSLLRDRNVSNRPVCRALARFLFLVLIQSVFVGVMTVSTWALF